MKQINNIKKVVEGVNTAAEIIASTMGAEGKLVVIKSNGKLQFTKDGVTVANSISFNDPEMNIGADILKAATKKTVQQTGDGTSATSVLLNAFLNQFKDTEISLELLNELDTHVDYSLKAIDKITQKVETVKDVYNLAKVSSNSEVLAELFKETYSKVGLDSLVTIESPLNHLKTSLEIKKGVKYTNGFVNHAFVTDKNTEKVVYENPYIYTVNKGISTITPEISTLIGASTKNNIPLVIIAKSFSDLVIRQLILNRVQKGTPVVAIKAPGFANGISKNLEDINAYLDNNNHVDKIVVDTHSFTIYNENTPRLKKHLDKIKSLAKNSVENIDKEDYKKRFYKLNQSTAIIYAGGSTPEKQSEEFDRLEDALGTVQSAIRTGYVPGGGLALYTSSEATRIKPILQAPYYQILKNASLPLVSPYSNDTAINVRTKKRENFLETGIIDSAAAVKQALINSYETFKLIINTSYILNND